VPTADAFIVPGAPAREGERSDGHARRPGRR
jgi:hypothetical protein